MTNKHELSVTRFIDAPPEAVYRIMTERAGEWFAPKPYTTPVTDWELRPGGRLRTVMRSPEGEDRPEGEGVFLAVVRGWKLVFTNLFATGSEPWGEKGGKK